MSAEFLSSTAYRSTVSHRQFEDAREPSVVALIDNDQTARQIRADVGAAGLRLIDTVLIDETNLSVVPSADLFWVELTEVPGVTAQAELTELWRSARGERTIVAAGLPMLDWAFALLADCDCALICADDRIERGLALTNVASRLAPALNEERGTSNELDRLRDEVGKIARALAGLTRADVDRLVGGGIATPDPVRANDWPFLDSSVADVGLHYAPQPAFQPFGDRSVIGITSHDLREIIRMRRLREKFFPAELFSDPAWDMLLDLMAARLDRRPVSVSSLCIASAVPATTALRWIKTMTEAGLFERCADPHDGRRVFIALAEDTAHKLASYFAVMRSVSSLLPV